MASQLILNINEIPWIRVGEQERSGNQTTIKLHHVDDGSFCDKVKIAISLHCSYCFGTLMVMPTVYSDQPLAEVVIKLQAWGQTKDHRGLCFLYSYKYTWWKVVDYQVHWPQTTRA